MTSKSEFKRIGIQKGLSLDDMIEIVEQPEYSWKKLTEYKEKYNINDKDFAKIIFHAEMYTKENPL